MGHHREDAQKGKGGICSKPSYPTWISGFRGFHVWYPHPNWIKTTFGNIKPNKNGRLWSNFKSYETLCFCRALGRGYGWRFWWILVGFGEWAVSCDIVNAGLCEFVIYLTMRLTPTNMTYSYGHISKQSTVVISIIWYDSGRHTLVKPTRLTCVISAHLPEHMVESNLGPHQIWVAAKCTKNWLNEHPYMSVGDPYRPPAMNH